MTPEQIRSYSLLIAPIHYALYFLEQVHGSADFPRFRRLDEPWALPRVVAAALTPLLAPPRSRQGVKELEKKRVAQIYRYIYIYIYIYILVYYVYIHVYIWGCKVPKCHIPY